LRYDTSRRFALSRESCKNVAGDIPINVPVNPDAKTYALALNGIDLKQLLTSRYPDLPVILITGNQEFLQLWDLENREPPYFFEKPFRREKLIAAVIEVSKKPDRLDSQR